MKQEDIDKNIAQGLNTFRDVCLIGVTITAKHVYLYNCNLSDVTFHVTELVKVNDCTLVDCAFIGDTQAVTMQRSSAAYSRFEGVIRCMRLRYTQLDACDLSNASILEADTLRVLLHGTSVHRLQIIPATSIAFVAAYLAEEATHGYHEAFVATLRGGEAKGWCWPDVWAMRGAFNPELLQWVVARLKERPELASKLLELQQYGYREEDYELPQQA